jgi:integrase
VSLRIAGPAIGAAACGPASVRPRQRKSKRAVTRDVLDRLLATCSSDRLAGTRDLAILLLTFASGGRRRSEGRGFASNSSATSRRTPAT